jgi:hypothetical protein
MPGVFKRVASAVGDGATAVRLAHEYRAGEHADELVLTPEGWPRNGR